MKKRIAGILALGLVGCGGGGGGGSEPVSGPAPTGTMAVQCVNVTNDGAAPCTAATAAGLVAARGDVSRSQAMWTSGRLANGTASQFIGSYQIHLVPGCDGQPDFVAAAGNVALNPGTTLEPRASRQCSAMPLGPAEMQLIIYAGSLETTCEVPPNQVCTVLPTGQRTCTPGDICETKPSGPEMDRGVARYNVTL